MPDLSPKFPDIVLPHLEAVELPMFRRVRVKQPDYPAVPDTAEAVRAALDAQAGLFALHGGAEVAVAVGSRQMQLDMLRAIEANGIRPVLDRHFPLAELAEAFAYQASNRHFGKIVVEI